ncbi:hypothetical protein PENTCL1PPCAC_29434, partial [Pristionchus entomophagus]
MFRFLRSQFSPEQQRPDDLSDFFHFRQTTRSGFPSGACATAVDNVLSIMAVGTQSGEIFIFGGSKAQWKTAVPVKSAVAYIYFAHGTGTFMVLCQDQTFHRFKMIGDKIEHHQIPPETRLKKITSCEMYQKKDLSDARLLIGTMTGNVFSIKMETCELSEFILYEDTIVPSLPSDLEGKSSIDGIAVNQKEPRRVLLVIDQKCVLIYDVNIHEVLRVYMQPVPVVHVSWCSDGTNFMLAHVAGGFTMLNSQEGSAQQSTGPDILFGPFPCTPVNKIFNQSTKMGDTLIFSGGLPRLSYGDRYTLTLKRGNRVSVFDFSSPLLDFALINETNDYRKDDYHIAGYVLILCEQEFLMVDLSDKNWREVPILSLHSLHFSQITTSTLCAHVEEHVWKEINKASEAELSAGSRYSGRKWPLIAGNEETRHLTVSAGEDSRQLLVTGHENGMIRLWAAGELTMKLLLSIKTAKEFVGYREDEQPVIDFQTERQQRDSMYSSQDSEDSDDGNPTAEWPPFYKLGEYDPFCDDHRLSIQKIAFDASSGQIVVGGRGGQVLVYQLADTAKATIPRGVVDPALVDLAKLPAHVLRNQPMKERTAEMNYGVGYQPFTVGESKESNYLQLKPATSITAVSVLSSRGLVAAASEFGFLVVDIRTKSVLVNCSLCSGQDLLEAGALDDALSRFKSMKKSIRQSFRRKKKAPRATTGNGTAASAASAAGPSTSGLNGTAGTANNSNNRTPHSTPVRALNGVDEDEDEEVMRPVERKIEARSERASPEQPSWLIRVLTFTKASMLSNTIPSDCLWVGSNGGRILCYVIAPREKPEESCRLVRDIRLEHGAPIVNILVQADPFAKFPISGSRLLVFTEEQIRAYTLPSLKNSRYKYKITALEGERIRKAALVKMASASDGHVDELFAAILTNQGNVTLFSLINPRKKCTANILKVTDILGMTSCVIAPSGELLFLRNGGAEYQRATIAKKTVDFESPFASSPYPPPLAETSSSRA